jgi:tetratricopeptide (TPR) repeat protein
MAAAIAVMIATSSGAAKSCDLKKAEQAINIEEYAMALTFLESCPPDGRYYKLKGVAHYSLFQADSAIVNLEKALERLGRDDGASIRLAEAYLWKKDFRRAMKRLGAVRDQSRLDYKRAYASVHEMTGNYAAAMAMYDSVLAFNPNAYDIRERKAALLAWTKKFDESIDLYTRLIETRDVPKSVRTRARVKRAQVIAWKKEFDRALAELDAVIADDGDNVEARLVKAEILEWKGAFKLAKDLYKDVLAIEPDNKKAKIRIERLLWVK